MSPRRALALVLALLAVIAAGCGLGAGEERDGGVSVLVSRDFGAQRVNAAEQPEVPAGETVMRLLQGNFAVETRHGGGFVQSIDGLEGGRVEGRRVDWFYYVNGIEASVGAAQRRLVPGDRVWWDHHDWGTTMHVPAVVGSFPEPFLSGTEGKRLPVRIDCAPGSERVCREVGDRLEEAGVKGFSLARLGLREEGQLLRVVVGPWQRVRDDPAARRIGEGPAVSGVFARFDAAGRRLAILDAQGRTVRTLGAGAGLVGATRVEEAQPTWVVTGTDAVGLAAAAAALEEPVLAGRFAVALERGRPVRLPPRTAP